MGNTNNHIITSLSSSIQQRTFQNGAVVAPFGFGHRGLQNLRGTCQPYSSFPSAISGSSMPGWDRSDCGVEDNTVQMLLITQDSPVYTPIITSGSTEWYTQIVSSSNPNNSSSLHVGSLYLDAQTYTTIGALFTDIKGGVGGSDAHVELRRFTTGVSLLTLNNTSTAGPTWRYITGSSVVVSTADWYDIYISASGNPATSSIRGVYYEI